MANPALTLFDDQPMRPRAQAGRVALFAVAANDNAFSDCRNSLTTEQCRTGTEARATDALGRRQTLTFRDGSTQTEVSKSVDNGAYAYSPPRITVTVHFISTRSVAFFGCYREPPHLGSIVQWRISPTPCPMTG